MVGGAQRPEGYRSHKRVFFSGTLGRAKPVRMKNEPQIPPSQALALERFALITQIQDLLRQGFPLSVALEQVSSSSADPARRQPAALSPAAPSKTGGMTTSTAASPL